VSTGIRLKVAYDGSGFAGFARQPGQRTVQGVLNEAAEHVARHPVLMRGASRTDSGVHALGQVVAFASERELPPERWARALNRLLPEDVAVRDAEPCAPDYDPRFDALDKTYRYLLRIGAQRDPLLRGRVWELARLVPRATGLDLDAMRACCALLAGTHDFRAFRAAADTRENTVRTLLRVELASGFAGDPALLALEVRGTAFMLNMVRILAGTLIDVGRGRLTIATVAELLSESGTRSRAGMTAPAHGLTLLEVRLGRTGGLKPAPTKKSAPPSPPDP
jgi:tRNA pseudouridine38-40 synthase